MSRRRRRTTVRRCEGAKVQQYSWHGVDHERFRVIDAGDGSFFLEAVHSGKVLDVAYADMGNEFSRRSPLLAHRRRRFRNAGRARNRTGLPAKGREHRD